MVDSNGAAGNEILNVDDRNSPVIQGIAPVLVFGSLITLNAVGGAYAGMGRELPEPFFFRLFTDLSTARHHCKHGRSFSGLHSFCFDP